MRTQEEISRRMRNQLQILDPEISLEPGTPERKIIDTVAQAIAETNVDIFVQTYQYDVDTRYGQDLDDFLSLFGFARQAAKRATGEVVFSRGTPAPAPVLIPAGTQIARGTNAVNAQVIFQTVVNGFIGEGQTEVTVPIEAVVPGVSGNIPANTITQFITNISNISGVTNLIATSGGTNDEGDAEFRLRFKNTIFRNIAGTSDQFLTLSIASAFTDRANIIGPISRFSEYVQIPSNGVIISNNPHSKYTYDFDFYLSDNGTETSEFYYPNIDYFFAINADQKPELTITPVIFVRPTTAPTVTAGTDPGNVTGTSLTWAYTFVYEYTTSDGTEILGESALSPESTELTMNAGQVILSVPTGGGTVLERRIYRKVNGEWFRIGEITNNTDTAFTDNNGVLGDGPPKAALQPEGIVFFEHAYLSRNSRNVINDDTETSILNKVDVFISGQDVQVAKDVIYGPPTGVALNNTTMVGDADSKFYNQNYRRDEDGTFAQIGNSLIDLLWSPVESIPSSMTIGNTTFTENQDYWLVRDVSNLRGSKRARDGIEMSSTMAAAVSGSRFIIEYTFNRLPLIINQVIDEHKQIGQDVLVHQANPRYFRVNLVVMYDIGFNRIAVNGDIERALETHFRGIPFGGTIQMSDILQAVHNVVGVDNVRLATVSDNANNYGVQEVNSDGLILEQAPLTSDFYIDDIDIAVFNSLGPTAEGPITRTQNTWVSGF